MDFAREWCRPATRIGALILALNFALGSVSPVAAAPVSANLEPGSITLGESATLTITALGSGIEPVDLPVVPDLKFRILQQSRRMEVIRGATVATVTTLVRVTPLAAGSYVIPGVAPGLQPLELRVNPDAASAGARAPRPAAAAGTAAGIVMAADGAAFVRMIVPKSEVYVGESLPVSIEVGMRAGFVKSVNGLPTLAVGDFTLNNLSRQPERVEKSIDGKAFAVLTWHSALAAIKPGTFSLSVQAPLTVKIRTRPQRETQLEDQLGDPFLQNIFGASVQKELQIASPPAEMRVLALPEGRPADFSGAVGSFAIADSITPAAAAVGEPLTLRMSVTGAGNFDRVDSAMLGHLDAWKTYPPTSHFTAGDALGYKGEKTFEQPIVASKAGVQRLPALAFSYFDPATRRYETARSAPLEVTVAASAAQRQPQAAATGPPLRGLRPDHAPDGRVSASLVPLYLRPPFLAVPTLLSLSLAAGWLRLRRRPASGAGAADGSRRWSRAQSKAMKLALARMDQAAREGAGGEFYVAARDALRLVLAARGQSVPIPMTAEAAARFGPVAAEVRELLGLADAADYAGGAFASRHPGAEDYARWIRLVHAQIGARPS
jgi:hypothetical protein